MKKILAVIVALVVLGFFGWRIYEKISASREESNQSRRSAAVAVEAAPIKKDTIRDVGSFTGSLLAKSYFVVAPKIAGRLKKLLVNIGDHVKRGQLIATLDDEEYSQQVEQSQAALSASKAYLEKAKQGLIIAERDLATQSKRAQAALEAAQARYNDAQSKSDRQKQLLEKKLTSEEEYETAQTAVVQAAAALESAKMQMEELNTQEKALELKRQDVALAQADVAQKDAALKVAQVRLSYAQILASWEDGEEQRVVGERFVDEGALLAPNTPIVSILDVHSLTALLYVIERDYYKMRLGQQAVVETDALPGKSFIGTIVRIAPLLRETSRQARVEVEVSSSEELLKPGMFVRVQIQFAEHKDTTVVPITSLARRNGQQGVFLVDPQKKDAHFTPVELGIVNTESAEVLAPPLTGLVVTLGHHLLEDGSAVILPESKSEGSRSQQSGPTKPTAREKTESGGKQ
jgi:RND family efflux transporter MFP subunit